LSNQRRYFRGGRGAVRIDKGEPSCLRSGRPTGANRMSFTAILRVALHGLKRWVITAQLSNFCCKPMLFTLRGAVHDDLDAHLTGVRFKRGAERR
jgi:hypothetical protein